jgi:MFS family permease
MTNQSSDDSQKNEDVPSSPTALSVNSTGVKEQTKHTWRFWAIIISLSIAGTLCAIEATIITSPLPTIIADLGGGELYIWVANAFFLGTVATLPLYGQASNILGRRWLMISAVALFTIGSGISGGSTTMKMLIAGRTIQGLGGGGINMLIELIVTDLVPLRERGTYMALVQIAGSLGAAMGPFLGGVITSHTSWRWVFYLNVPIGGGKIFPFKHLKAIHQTTKIMLTQ